MAPVVSQVTGTLSRFPFPFPAQVRRTNGSEFSSLVAVSQVATHALFAAELAQSVPP